MLIDAYGRVIDYIRISLTSKCNFRCQYCMSEDGVPDIAHQNVLSYEQMFDFVKICIDGGVKKVRITGGEPLVRRGVESFISMIYNYAPYIDLAMTTNGYYLKQKASALKDAGLKRLNISLDTLDARKFCIIARRDGFERVIEGINEACALNFNVKLNTVAMRGVNDNELLSLIDYAASMNAQIRFIEYMENIHASTKIGSMSADDILQIIATKHEISEITKSPHSPSRLFKLENGYIFGLINPHNCDFCSTCNRIRLSSEGLLIPCLYFDEGRSILKAMQAGDISAAKQILADVLANKPEKNRWQSGEISARAFYETGG